VVGGGSSSTTRTYTYKLGDKPPQRSDYSSSKDYSSASYAYSKNKRAVVIERVNKGLSVSDSELRGAGIQKLSDRAIRTVSGGKKVMESGGYRYYDSATKKYVTVKGVQGVQESDPRSISAQRQQKQQEANITGLRTTTTQSRKRMQ